MGLGWRPTLLDKIELPRIPVRARVGCTEEERELPQTITIDVELRCDLRPAARADDIDAAIDYVAVLEEVRVVADSRNYALIETIAEAVAERLLAAFPVSETTVRVRKPSALKKDGVPWAGVEITRTCDA